MAPRLITGLEPARVRANADAVRAEIADAARVAGRDPGAVQLLAATKYVATGELGVLAEAGLALAGENRAQALAEKAAAQPGLTWDFIGALQSRKVRQILPLVRWVHSVATDSALRELARHGTPATRVLVEVNIAGEDGKAGVAPPELPAFLERAAAGGTQVIGLMTMPPLARRPEDSRRWFAALRELAAEHGLPELSMGTTQDFSVAVQEGATVVRVGTRLYA